MHDQDAYVVDQNEIGDFTAIGYDGPNSNYFKYEFKNKDTWTATSYNKGPTCANAWTVKSEKNGNNKAKHTPSAGCPELTPNFANIGGSSS